jgi:hypothetical protein
MQYVPNAAYDKLLEKGLKDKLGDIILLGIYAYLGRPYGLQVLEAMEEDDTTGGTKEDFRMIINAATGRDIAADENVALLENRDLPKPTQPRQALDQIAK